MKKTARKYFDNLFSIKQIKTADENPNLFDKVNRSLKGLKTWWEDIDNWSLILCYLISADKHISISKNH